MVISDKICTSSCDLDNVENVRYSRIYDTPFDESVYSVNHSLKCVGSSKSQRGALRPI